MTFTQLVILLLLISLQGCMTTTQKETILPQTGPSMQEVYNRHFQPGQHRFNANRSIKPKAGDLKGYTLEAYNESRAVFSRLPNPDLVMYVFPHLAGPEAAPIPGYSTVFPFYDKVEYALPGEME